MKPLLLIFLCSLLIGSSCRKHKPIDPVSQLPPETQTGANTFGCLVNGQVFKPGGAQLSGGSLSCNYQFVNGGYYFRLAAISRNNNTGESKSIGLFTDSLRIEQGIEYIFSAPQIKGGAYAVYGYSKPTPMTIYDYETNQIYNGTVLVKKLDTVNQIISGTFRFKAVSTNSDTVKITDGRFDVHYTR